MPGPNGFTPGYSFLNSSSFRYGSFSGCNPGVRSFNQKYNVNVFEQTNYNFCCDDDDYDCGFSMPRWLENLMKVQIGCQVLDQTFGCITSNINASRSAKIAANERYQTKLKDEQSADITRLKQSYGSSDYEFIPEKDLKTITVRDKTTHQPIVKGSYETICQFMDGKLGLGEVKTSDSKSTSSASNSVKIGDEDYKVTVNDDKITLQAPSGETEDLTKIEKDGKTVYRKKTGEVFDYKDGKLTEIKPKKGDKTVKNGDVKEAEFTEDNKIKLDGKELTYDEDSDTYSDEDDNEYSVSTNEKGEWILKNED